MASSTDRSVVEAQLRLEWIYGYQGKEFRNNLVCNVSGDVVYFVAGVAIVFNTTAREQQHYREHNDDVTCLALHPKRVLVATGEMGKSPSIFVWDSTSLATKSILQGSHTADISSIGFGGASDRFLVSSAIDVNNTIVVWDWKRGLAISSVEGSSSLIFDVKFNPYKTNAIVSCHGRNLKFWTMTGNVLLANDGVCLKDADASPQGCVAFGPDEITYSGGENGSIYVWKGYSMIYAITDAHADTVHSIAMCREGYASCSQDGTCRLWDTAFESVIIIDLAQAIGYNHLAVSAVIWEGRQVICGTEAGEVISVQVSENKTQATILSQGHPATGELWGLACHPDKGVFATASEDRTVRLWDMHDRELLAVANLPEDARAVAFSNDSSMLQVAVGMKKGCFAVYDASHLNDSSKHTSAKVIEMHEVYRYQERSKVIHELKYSPDNKYLAVGSNDGVVDIFAISWKSHSHKTVYKHVGICKGLDSHVAHLDFDINSSCIQVNSGGGKRLIFAIPSGNQITDKPRIKTIRWKTWTCVLGDEVNGIWDKYGDTEDVNATHARAGVVVTGDDFGKVKMYPFPCINKGAKCREYRGHSADVTNVRFSHDERRVITTGGADHSVFQWLFHAQGGAHPVDGHESYVEESESDDEEGDGVDSDIEREASVSYDREFAKEIPRSTRRANNAPRSKFPDCKLALQRVNGYRGYDCRNNMHFLKSGELVYHVAAVAIVHNIQSDAQRFYQKHIDDILCLATHPGGEHVATGQIGRSAEIHVWDTQALNTVAVLTGHERGVCALDFSVDGKRLISIGLDQEHMVLTWDWQKGVKLAEARGHRDKIFMVRWNPFSKNSAVTVGIRHLKFWTQAGNGFTSKRAVFGKAGKVETMLCVEFSQKNGCMYSGASNGMIYEWEGQQLRRTIQANEGPVFCLVMINDVLMSGGKGGRIRIWDESTKHYSKEYIVQSSSINAASGMLKGDGPAIRAITIDKKTSTIAIGTANSEVVTINNNQDFNVINCGHGEGELWGLATTGGQFIATAGDDKTIRIWDAKSFKLLRMKTLSKPVRACAVSPNSKLIATGTMDGSVTIFDSSNLGQVSTYHHRKKEISCLMFSPNGQYLAAGSHDRIVDIYDTTQKKRVGVCKSASSYITHVDWSTDGTVVLVNTGAKEELVFEAPKGKRINVSKEAMENLMWDTSTVVLSEKCKGVWPPASDVTDVNAAHVTSAGDVVATGDDFGLVKLFQYPSTGAQAKFKKYLGHSAHVTKVRWSHDNAHLITTGGGDTAMLVWEYGNGQKLQHSELLGAAGDSDDSDTDDDEDGYDSDVEREKNQDYSKLTYKEPLRPKAGVRPQQKLFLDQQTKRTGRQVQPKAKVSRSRARSAVDTDAKNTISDVQLCHVHGYRGYDCRENLQYNGQGQAVYHAAATGIVMDPVTKVQSFYSEHTDDIVSLDMNPEKSYSNVVVTGQIGEDADIHIWETTSLQTLAIIRGFHKTAVCALSFSSSGKLLLSVDASENRGIAIYKWANGMLLASASGPPGRIFVAKFKSGNEKEFVTCGVKHVKFWTVAGNQLRGVRGIVADRKIPTMLSLTFGENGITYTGSVIGEIYMWKKNQAIKVVPAHSGPIFSMLAVPANLFGGSNSDLSVVTGGKDARIRFWNADLKSSWRTCKLPQGTIVRAVGYSKRASTHARDHRKLLIGTHDSDIYEILGNDELRPLTFGHSLGELWGLASHPLKPIFASGSDDKTICTWNLDTHDLLVQVNVEVGCRSLAYSPDGSELAAGLINGTILILSSKSLKTKATLRDRKGPINVVKYSPDGKYLAVGAECESMDLYRVQTYTREGYTSGEHNTGFVMSLDWAKDNSCVRADTSDFKKLCFSIPDCKPLSLHNTVWASWSSILGEESIGIWPEKSDKADVNCCDLAHNGETLVTGDDFGHVKLFTFPCSQTGAPFKRYTGHAEHVTNVKFSYDDRNLMSTGGADSCIFVWKTIFEV